MAKKLKFGFVMLSATIGYAGSAHARLEPMDDAELGAVHGKLAILPGLVNIGPLFNLPFTAVNLFGATSLVSGLNMAALSGGSVLNAGGVAGISVANTLGFSAFTGISLPLGITGVAGVSMPWSINGLGVLNIF